MIRVPRRVAVLGTVFTRRVPRASARQRSCAGAGGPRDGYTSFLKSDSTSCVVSGSRGVGTLGHYGAYFNRAEKSVSLRATNLFRNLLWHGDSALSRVRHCCRLRSSLHVATPTE